MKRAVIFVGSLLVAAACSSPMAGEPSAAGGPASGPPATPTSVPPPPSPEPAGNGPCPYLENAFVADANGQRVGRVRVSADQPHPACFFYRTDGKVQLTVQVYVGDPGAAKALVDREAPRDTSNPAELPGGWVGGAQPTDSGAVFAVAKAGTAVVITTNQAQTIKARRVAEKAIAALAL
jgi:UPF0176 protein